MDLGKFEIIEELGKGGFGIVYLALDKVLDRQVALKVLHPELLINPNFILRFKQEAQLSARLDHPNILPVYDFGEFEGRYYIVMAYMPDGSLKDLLREEGKLDKQRSLKIFEQICDGMNYAHSQKVIHRDLKPGNILFDSRGNARISDMGFAKLIHSDSSASMSSSGRMVGTPSYMAPEIWQGKPASSATDVYSLACVLVEMLTGQTLFAGETTPEIMMKHFAPLILPEDLPEEWKPVLEAALEKQPEERTQTVGEFFEKIKAVKEIVMKAEPANSEEAVEKVLNEAKAMMSKSSDKARSKEEKSDEVSDKVSKTDEDNQNEEVQECRNSQYSRQNRSASIDIPRKKSKPVIIEARERKTKSGLIYIGLLFLAIVIGVIIFQIVNSNSKPASTITPTDTPVMPSPSSTSTGTPTHTPTITPTPTHDGPSDYYVQADDYSCADIAEKFNVDLEIFLYVNGMSLGDLCTVREGLLMKIPAPSQQMPTSTPVPTDLAPGTIIDYYVEAGATLSTIATNFHSTPLQIITETNRYRTANGITVLLTENTVLRMGDLLKVPANIATPIPSSNETDAVLGIGSMQTREMDEMEQVYVPAGTFIMGSDDFDWAKPVRTVYLDAYWIDKYEVTEAQYKHCVDSGSCTSLIRSSVRGYSYENHPVTNVNWHQAKTYCEWAGGDLPTEAQWEKASRGIGGNKYPWGNQEPDKSYANYDMNIGDTTEVGLYEKGASPYGAMDMAGNVEEWVNDLYVDKYDETDIINPQGPDSGIYRVIRGGSWIGDKDIPMASRAWRGMYVSFSDLGFRCVSSP